MMMTPIYGFAYGVLNLLGEASVKASLLLALAAILILLSRRASAAFRHLAWALALGCTLCLPLLSRLPHWRIPVTTPATHLQPTAASEDAPLPAPASHPVTRVTAAVNPKAGTGTPPQAAPAAFPAGPQPSVQTPARLAALVAPADVPQIPWAIWALLVWTVGVLVVLAQLAHSLVIVRRIARAGVPVTDGPMAEVAAAAAEAMRVNRPVALRQASSVGEVTVPLIFGAWRPVLLVPAGAQEWPSERLKAALLHEMAHVRRNDWPIQMMAHVARAVYWFNPLAWLAARGLRAEAEAACDDLVLGAGLPARDYARHLLDVALSARDSRRVGGGAVAMAQSPKVEGRLRAVLAQSLSRRPVSRGSAAGLLAAALLLALPLATLRLVAQGQAVPAADRLQLQGDFTLRYAVTITDEQTPQAQFREYQQLRADYRRELKKDPYFQPVPAEFYGPFSYFQSLRPKTRHVVLTVSAQGKRLLWQSTENGNTYALVYDGQSTHSYGNGHAGSVQPIFEFGEMSNCPLPAVGLPYAPMIKTAAVASMTGLEQTWKGQCLILNSEGSRNSMVYLPGTIQAIKDERTWKILSTDSLGQRLDFLEHQRFHDLWLASHFRLTNYDIDGPLPPKGEVTTMQQMDDWFRATRKLTSTCEYRLLSATSTPLDMSAVGMRSVSAPMPGPQHPANDDFEVQEALHLRYHLQDWAEAHKTLLLQMAQARPNARTAAMRVATALNSLPFPLWQGDSHPSHVWDGDPRTGHDGQKPLFTAERPSPGTLSHDFEIAHSRNPGRVHIVLWASGRILRVTTRGTGGMEIQQEIVPAFFGADGTSQMAADVPEPKRSTPMP